MKKPKRRPKNISDAEIEKSWERIFKLTEKLRKNKKTK